jgi:hypothetical protein
MILRENDNIIDDLEASMMGFPDELIEGPLVHKFTDGMYIREIFMPAGSLWTSKIHKTEHPYVVSYGKAAVSVDADEWYEITAPYTGITKPGTRRVLYILEDCIWTTFHRIDGMKSEYNDLSEKEIEKIVESIEDKILEPHINQITGTNIGEEYKKILQNQNKELCHSQQSQ